MQRSTLEIVFEIFDALFSIPSVRSGEGDAEEIAQLLIEQLPPLSFENAEQATSYLQIMVLAAYSGGAPHESERAMLYQQTHTIGERWSIIQQFSDLSSWAESTQQLLTTENIMLEGALHEIVKILDTSDLREGSFVHVLGLLLINGVVPSEVDYSRALAHAFGFSKLEKFQLIERAERISKRIARSKAEQRSA